MNDVDICPYEENSEPFEVNTISFNPDLYQITNIPHNILRIGKRSEEKISNWNYYYFTQEKEKKFVEKKFPQYFYLYENYTTQEEKNNLFKYLWLYKNGGIFVDTCFDFKKSPESLLVNSETSLYFMYDDQYISPNFIISQPLSNFWLKVISLMEERQTNYITDVQDRIDINTGKKLLTEVYETISNECIVVQKEKLLFDDQPYLSVNNEMRDNEIRDELKNITLQTPEEKQSSFILICMFVFILVFLAIVFFIN
jgi:mannosyltransferase OCH1-like enzyme